MLIRREITRKYTIKIVLKHAHAWNWDGKGGRNFSSRKPDDGKVQKKNSNPVGIFY
jgi:hypothetical protein